LRRVRLRFANLQVEFVDRELALKKIEEWAERGTFPVQVVYGPEGCGKTAWLRQGAELLRELEFDVIYINPVERELVAEVGVASLRERLADLIKGALSQLAWGAVAWSAIDAAREAIRLGRRRLAIIVDDAFQAIGLDKAALYVKGLLGVLEHPPEAYERAITVAATSEGVSLREIGRHEWAGLLAMWNMPREGFRQLYEQIPGGKPGFEEVWKVTGGNPRILEGLYGAGWDARTAARELLRRKGITPQFVAKWRSWLERAVSDPDALWSPDAPEELISELVERNLILYFLPDRDPRLWVDQPPPERDPVLGVGRRVAWQTPLHRDAIKTALEDFGR